MAYHCCVPLYAEQEHNALLAVKRQYALRSDIKSFTSYQLENVMREVMNSSQIRNNVAKASTILHDRRAPADEMTYWIEHVIKHGGEHLRPATLDMPLYEMLCLDILAVGIASSIVIFVLMSLLCLKCCKLCYRQAVKTPRKTKRE